MRRRLCPTPSFMVQTFRVRFAKRFPLSLRGLVLGMPGDVTSLLSKASLLAASCASRSNSGLISTATPADTRAPALSLASGGAGRSFGPLPSRANRAWRRPRFSRARIAARRPFAEAVVKVELKVVGNLEADSARRAAHSPDCATRPGQKGRFASSLPYCFSDALGIKRSERNRIETTLNFSKSSTRR
jgi:hypothetical protein